jgi:hypothetical protein
MVVRRCRRFHARTNSSAVLLHGFPQQRRQPTGIGKFYQRPKRNIFSFSLLPGGCCFNHGFVAKMANKINLGHNPARKRKLQMWQVDIPATFYQIGAGIQLNDFFRV